MRHLVLVLLGVLVIGILAIGGSWALTESKNGMISMIKNDETAEYSAVFLSNNQVYFGKIAKMTKSEIDLREIYYLQVNPQGEKSAETADDDILLVKLGDEIHRPADQMVINRDQVMFVEPLLKNNSRVIDAIAEYKQKKAAGQ